MYVVIDFARRPGHGGRLRRRRTTRVGARHGGWSKDLAAKLVEAVARGNGGGWAQLGAGCRGCAGAGGVLRLEMRLGRVCRECLIGADEPFGGSLILQEEKRERLECACLLVDGDTREGGFMSQLTAALRSDISASICASCSDSISSHARDGGRSTGGWIFRIYRGSKVAISSWTRACAEKG